MIYAFPDEDRPIRQGDIFISLPRANLSLKKIAVVKDDCTEETSWIDIVKENGNIEAVLPIQSVCAIVASQNCDIQSSIEITLCEISKFSHIEGKAQNANQPNSWQKIITQQARINLKWFYLPPDEKIGFKDKMAVDFRRTLRIPTNELNNYKTLRKGRLNALAYQHFRERISEFYRRYPYNEWYPLNKDEMHAYEIDKKMKVDPHYPWQS